MKSMRWHVGVVAIAICSIAGCGGSNSKLPPLGAVTGVVTLDGVPLKGALVEFNPEASPEKTGKNQPASGGSSGLTNESGKYSLKFDAQTQGAVLGTHRVRVVELSVPDPNDGPPKPLRIPAKYNWQSQLTYNVKGGSNLYDLDLRTN